MQWHNRNPILEHLKNARYSMRKDIVPDFVLGTSTSALLIQLKFHQLHPNHLQTRMREFGDSVSIPCLLVDPHPQFLTP
jgi:DNA repair protein Rad10